MGWILGAQDTYKSMAVKDTAKNPRVIAGNFFTS